MTAYQPQTEADRRSMLSKIGVEKLDALFEDIPAAYRYPELTVKQAVSEIEILRELKQLGAKNSIAGENAIFLGAGAYTHYVPSAVTQLSSRGEFVTAYTPYQPEVSQGTLQSIFEYQSMMAELLAMDVVNASHYDGATSMAEAVVMSYNVSRGKRHKVIVSPDIDPQYRKVLRTYIPGKDLHIHGDENPDTTLDDLKSLLDDKTACLIIQNPNFFGELIDVEGLADTVHEAGALLVVVANPIISLGLLKPPGEYGADIVVAEGQPFGAGLNFGGPYLGVFAAREKYVRKMPGRLVGETIDGAGKRGYVMTLTPREQHIRREKATSNICSNQGLIALKAGMYLAYMGKQGMREVAELCYHRAHYAASEIDKLEGYTVRNSKPFFNEFVIECPKPVNQINAALLEHGIIGGYNLEQDYPEWQNQMLLCVTEMNDRQQIDHLIAILKEIG